MPLFGEFEFSGETIIFKGREIPSSTTGEPQPLQPPMASIGILLGSQKMLNGRLSGSIEFAEVDHLSVCEFIIGYDPKTKGQLCAGLGGGPAMFSIREWNQPTPQGSGSGWFNYEASGERANLHPRVRYDVEVQVEGSNITLQVDGVQVGAATLATSPNQPRQIGLFCVSKNDIRIVGFRADVERPKAFIVMQFSSPYNEVYSHVIKNICGELGVAPIRADEMYGPGIIIKDVIDQIARSQVVIADISPSNPNVYFEVGYALALDKPIILLAQRPVAGASLPFDLSAFRVLFYDDSIGGKPMLEEGLRNHLREILGGK
jgi:hypothetical protein